MIFWSQKRKQLRRERELETLQYRLVLATEILKRVDPELGKLKKETRPTTPDARERFWHLNFLDMKWSRCKQDCMKALGLDSTQAASYDGTFIVNLKHYDGQNMIDAIRKCRLIP